MGTLYFTSMRSKITRNTIKKYKFVLKLILIRLLEKKSSKFNRCQQSLVNKYGGINEKLPQIFST